MKYFLLKCLPFLPMELINEIYEFIDQLKEIKEKKRYKFKRLIGHEYYYYPLKLKKYCLFTEEKHFQILIKNKAYHLIDNIHSYNLRCFTELKSKQLLLQHDNPDNT